MSTTPRLALELRRLRRLLAASDRRIAHVNLAGKVAEVDASGRRARLQIDVDEDGAPVLGPWATWEESAVGSLAAHTPLKVGQQASYQSPAGVLGDGSTIRARAFDGDNQAPSDATDSAVFAFGTSRIEIGAGGVRISGAGITIDGPLAVNGASLTHNGANVGDDHTHSGVEPGGANTGPPS